MRWAASVGSALFRAALRAGTVLGGTVVSGTVVGGMALGCSASGFQVQTHAIATQKPGQVAAYLAVSGDEGARSLTAENFTLYEDGHPLAADGTRQVLLDKNRVAVHHTLVLFDLSDTTDPIVQREVRDSVWFFVDRVEETQAVSVYGYDGSAKIRLIADFPRQEKARELPLAERLVLPKGDRSRNLNGAMIEAAEVLDKRLSWSGRPLRFGTLVVFASGPDLAARASRAEVEAKLSQTTLRVIGVGYGDGSAAVRPFARDGFFEAHLGPVVSLAFEDAAHAVEARYEQEYLLAYCSPSRAGTRNLRIEASRESPDGERRAGTAHAEFNADGFTEHCDPRRMPLFDALTFNDR